MLAAGIGIGYAARTYMITQSLGGFPGGTTSLWIVGANATLGAQATPQVGSSGTFTYSNAVSITCGGLSQCNVTATVANIPSGWTLDYIGGCGMYGVLELTNGANLVIVNGPHTYTYQLSACSPTNPTPGSYSLSYVNYPATSLPAITVTWTWTA